MGDVIILACKPQAVEALLSQPEILDALEGKLLISICAGVTMDQLLDIVESRGKGTKNGQEPCCIVRAMPNTAAFIGQSSTVISIPPRPLSPERATLVDWIFSRIGRVFYLPADKMDACTALCGSGPAFVAVICEAMADGAVNNGIPRKEALEMSAQVLKGAAEMILQGEHPAILKDKVCTPAGCTIAGLLELEDGRVRSTVARAVDKATLIASQLGQGTKSKTAR